MGCAGDGGPECEVFLEGFVDADGDGFGAGEAQAVCRLGDLVDNDRDCNDEDPLVFPGAEELCNGLDDDCNGELDNGLDLKTWYADADGDGFGGMFPAQRACERPEGDWVRNTDPASKTSYHLDADLDGYGDPDIFVELCTPRAGYAANPDDCDDDDASITQYEFYEDADLDGYGNPSSYVLACEAVDGAASNGDDCDDTDPDVNVPQDWLLDADGDGAGVGASVVFQCLDPGPGLAPAANGLDCDDNDPLRAPQFVEACGDGIDQNCDGSDSCTTCQDWLDADPTSPNGVYTIEPGAGQLFDVFCDMTTDGGGWTLVASTAVTTLNDEGTSSYYPGLRTLQPTSGNTGIWRGLRGLTTAGSDIRFACKLNPTDATMAVDLSFYQNTWYQTITTGTDTQSCFYNGGQALPAPERRNNITGATLPAGDIWNSGVLEGEDSCSDTTDFTVDFDDRGMDSNQADGTDWGEDDGSKKCGTTAPANGAWFIFVREL